MTDSNNNNENNNSDISYYRKSSNFLTFWSILIFTTILFGGLLYGKMPLWLFLSCTAYISCIAILGTLIFITFCRYIDEHYYLNEFAKHFLPLIIILIVISKTTYTYKTKSNEIEMVKLFFMSTILPILLFIIYFSIGNGDIYIVVLNEELLNIDKNKLIQISVAVNSCMCVLGLFIYISLFHLYHKWILKKE